MTIIQAKPDCRKEQIEQLIENSLTNQQLQHQILVTKLSLVELSKLNNYYVQENISLKKQVDDSSFKCQSLRQEIQSLRDKNCELELDREDLNTLREQLSQNQSQTKLASFNILSQTSLPSFNQSQTLKFSNQQTTPKNLPSAQNDQYLKKYLKNDQPINLDCIIEESSFDDQKSQKSFMQTNSSNIYVDSKVYTFIRPQNHKLLHQKSPHSLIFNDMTMVQDMKHARNGNCSVVQYQPTLNSSQLSAKIQFQKDFSIYSNLNQTIRSNDNVSDKMIGDCDDYNLIIVESITQHIQLFDLKNHDQQISSLQQTTIKRSISPEQQHIKTVKETVDLLTNRQKIFQEIQIDEQSELFTAVVLPYVIESYRVQNRLKRENRLLRLQLEDNKIWV